MSEWCYRSALGEDSHRFVAEETGSRQLVLAGVVLPGEPALEGNSDADVILHAVTNAISGITGHNILGGPADELCRQGMPAGSEYPGPNGGDRAESGAEAGLRRDL